MSGRASQSMASKEYSWWGWLGFVGLIFGGAAYGVLKVRKPYGKWRVGMLHRSSTKHHKIAAEKMSKALRMAERYGVSTKTLTEIAESSAEGKDALRKLKAEIAAVTSEAEANKTAFVECCQAANKITNRKRVPTAKGGRPPGEWKDAFRSCRSEVVKKRPGISLPDPDDKGFAALAKGMGL